jgi:hypothetical protein
MKWNATAAPASDVEDVKAAQDPRKDHVDHLRMCRFLSHSPRFQIWWKREAH